MKKFALACLALLSLFVGDVQAETAVVPVVPNLRFAHYTFAMLWQPGVCATWTRVGAACDDLTPASRASQQWSLHGLWASRPQQLIASGMEPKTWWQHGCFWFRNQSMAPHDSCSLPSLELSPAVSRELTANMPMRKVCLDRHEYYKHEACIGEKPDPFFQTALRLLRDVNASSFTAYVRDHHGQWVKRNDLLRAYGTAFHLPNAKSLELRCESKDNHSGHELQGEGTILTEAWITIRASALQEFPRPGAFMAGRKGNCAKLIHILP